jgi:hypothetical protein
MTFCQMTCCQTSRGQKSRHLFLVNDVLLKGNLVEVVDDVEGCVEDDDERYNEAENHQKPSVNVVKLILFVTDSGRFHKHFINVTTYGPSKISCTANCMHAPMQSCQNAQAILLRW